MGHSQFMNILHPTIQDPKTILQRKRPLLALMRVRLGGLLVVSLLAMMVPIVLPLPFTTIGLDNLASENVVATFLFSIMAAAGGYFLLRQVSLYPGSQGTAYVLPALVVSYSIAVVVMFFFRIDYSRYTLLGTFFACSLWLTFVHWYNDKARLLTLALVPGGNLRDVMHLRQAQWRVLESPGQIVRDLDGVVADLHADLSSEWEAFIATCIIKGIPVYDVKSICESLTGQVELEHLSENTFGEVLPSMFYLRLKRVFDFALALFILPVFLIIIVTTAVCVKLESRGPAFFVQPRLGFRMNVFRIYKLRSMRVAHDESSFSTFTQQGDSRITRVGVLIRKYRIDELPQIFNIMKGEMSWIGPRPESLDLAKHYVNDVPFYLYRYAVRPGLSGWAQVNQGNVGTVDDEILKLRYDFYYAKNVSPWLDLLIAVKTIVTMLTGFGSR